MYRKTLTALEAAVAEFNKVTGRPERAYDEGQDRVGEAANIGHAYVRNLGLQHANRVAVSIIINYGGGVVNIYGLTGYVGEVLQTLRSNLKDPAWVELHKFDGSRWRPNPPIVRMPVDILQKVSARGVDLQVFVIDERASLCVDSDTELASHANPYACHILMQRVLQESEERVMEQVGYIESCGGRTNRELIAAVANRLHAPPNE